jgi:hypothetical protein
VLLLASPGDARQLADRVRAATGWDVTTAHHPHMAASLLSAGRWRAVLCAAQPNAVRFLSEVKAQWPNVQTVLLSAAHVDGHAAEHALVDAQVYGEGSLASMLAPLLDALGAQDTTPPPQAPPHEPLTATTDRPFRAPPPVLPRVETPAPRRWSNW